MKTPFVCVAISIALVACGGTKTLETAATPAVVTPKLTDAEVTDIAVAAAETLEPGAASTIYFAGVFVDGRRARPASDAVTRVTGFKEGDQSRSAPQCRATNASTGQSIAVPCPASTAQSMPPTYSFVEVRKMDDLAYVGVELKTLGSVKASCINLRQIGARWTVLKTMVAGDAKRCGK